MDEESVRKVSPWEIRLLADAAEGLTYREIALRRKRKPRTIERTFERLRDKLRPYGGGLRVFASAEATRLEMQR